MTEEQLSWAQGNSHVADFIQLLIDSERYLFETQKIFSSIRRIDTLRGTNLSILFRVLGNSDPELIAQLCTHVPDAVLVKACSCLFSGRELTLPYLTSIPT